MVRIVICRNVRFRLIPLYLMRLSFKFHKDPSFGCGDICKRIMTFIWRFCARSRQNVCAQVYASCARVCARIFSKLFSFGLFYLMNLSFKSYKDPSFSYGDICKTMLTFVWSLIFYVLFFLIWASKFHPSVKIIWNLLERMETLYQNVLWSVKIWHQF